MHDPGFSVQNGADYNVNSYGEANTLGSYRVVKNCNQITFAFAYRCPTTTLQVRVLGKQLDEMQAGKQELVTRYEGQLQHVKEEVSNFKIYKD